MYGKAKKYLSEHGVRPSLQRAAIMNFLMKHRTHPTVDQIYTDLVRRMPTLSRTTVYNTLRVLAEKGVVLSLSLDAEHTHYDGFTEPHAHFICEKCKRIYDLEYSDDIREIADVQPIPGMTITSRIINYSGICPICSGAFDETHNQYYN